MSDWRRQIGRENPWNVKYWGVGNEPWGCGGNMAPEYYANLYRQYATYMTGFSDAKKMFRIASGPSSDNYQFTEVLMKNIPLNLMEGLAWHHYAVIDWEKEGPSVNFTEQQYFATMRQALLMEELVTKHAAIMDKYDLEKKVPGYARALNKEHTNLVKFLEREVGLI